MTGLELYLEILRSNQATLSMEEREFLRERFARLTDRQAEVLSLRLGAEDGIQRTREEVAEATGLTLERVRQLENAALRKLTAHSHIPARKISEYYQS